jgi:hypothetical protein
MSLLSVGGDRVQIQASAIGNFAIPISLNSFQQGTSSQFNALHEMDDNLTDNNNRNHAGHNNTINQMSSNNKTSSSTIGGIDFSDLDNEIQSMERQKQAEIDEEIRDKQAQISRATNPIASLPSQSGASLAFHSSIASSYDRKHNLGLISAKKMNQSKKQARRDMRKTKKALEVAEKNEVRGVKAKFKVHQKRKAKY